MGQHRRGAVVGSQNPRPVAKDATRTGHPRVNFCGSEGAATSTCGGCRLGWATLN